MLEVELNLGQAQPGPVRVHRHADLHPESGSEGRNGRGRGGCKRTLTGDRRGRLEPGQPPDRPAGEAERDPEAATCAAREARHRQVGTIEGVHQPRQLPGGVAEVAVAEDEFGQRPVRTQPCDRQVGNAALAEPRRRADQLCALLQRDVRRGVRRSVVGDDYAGVGERLSQRPQRVAKPLRLVPGGHDYRGHTGYRGGPSYQEVVSLPDVEAHITGTVWKVECQVGQEVEEGDTLVILESMKMEMPVEAEDEGKVKEIKCEEGQSVSEGDTLVVLE